MLSWMEMFICSSGKFLFHSILFGWFCWICSLRYAIFFVFERMSFPFLTMSWFFLCFTSLSKFISSFFFPFKSAGLHQGSTRKQTEWFIDYLAKNSAFLKKIRRGLSQYHRHRKRFKFFSLYLYSVTELGRKKLFEWTLSKNGEITSHSRRLIFST